MRSATDLTEQELLFDKATHVEATLETIRAVEVIRQWGLSHTRSTAEALIALAERVDMLEARLSLAIEVMTRLGASDVDDS